MTNNEKPAFVALIADVLGYWKQDVSKFALAVWWSGCQKFDFDQVSRALSDHATDPDKGQFAPKVADIVRILGGTKTDRSLREWGRVHQAMASVGAYQDVDFGDGATHSAIRDMGGWAKVCRTEAEQLSYLQHRFCEIYKTYDGQCDGVPALMGDRSPDSEFEKIGLKPPMPVLLHGGNPTKANGFKEIQRHILAAIK